MTILVTGAAGFIGSHVCQRLLRDGQFVIGIDNMNAYYDPALKQARLTRLQAQSGFTFCKTDIADRTAMEKLFAELKPTRVVNLAAQAGVRYSLENPHAYAEANLIGFLNMLEGCRNHQVKHLVYASTSSVYGLNTTMPFSEHRHADHPMTFYAATKRANELMAHSYSHLFNLPTTGLRFFTVYGPWGRPDMALFKFAKAIISGEPMDVYNYGKMVRDFTYVDDIVEGIVRILDKPACADPAWSPADPDPASSSAPWRVYNIGNNKPVQLMDYIRAAEKALGRSAKINFLPMQPGDVPATQADVTALAATTGFTPQVTVDDGVARFIAWYREYNRA